MTLVNLLKLFWASIVSENFPYLSDVDNFVIVTPNENSRRCYLLRNVQRFMLLSYLGKNGRIYLKYIDSCLFLNRLLDES